MKDEEKLPIRQDQNTDVEGHKGDLRQIGRGYRRKKENWRILGMISAPSFCASLGLGLFLSGLLSTVLLTIAAVLWCSLLVAGYKIHHYVACEDAIDSKLDVTREHYEPPTPDT